MGNSGAKKGSSGNLQILEARYGWAGDIWGPEDCSHGAGCKDVTSIVRNDVKNGEIHLNPNMRPQYFNQHFWPETARGPPIPRKVAIRYMYVGGPVMELTTAAVPNETVCVHITPNKVRPHPREVIEKNILSRYQHILSSLSQGSIKFVGVWKDTGDSRGFPQHYSATGHERYDGKDVIREFRKFISDLEKSGEKVGYFGVQYGSYVGWVCGNNKQWQKHGKYGDMSKGEMSQQNAGLRVEGFDGVMEILGGPWQNAVYEVRLGNNTDTPGSTNDGKHEMWAQKKAGPPFPIHIGNGRDLGLVGSFTLAAWVYRDGEGDMAIFCGSKDSCQQRNSLHTMVRGGNFYFGFGWNDTSSSERSKKNQWQHCAFVYDKNSGGHQQIYVDGRKVADEGGHQPYDVGEDIHLGKGFKNGWPAPWQGRIKGAIVVNRAMSEGEIKEIANCHTGHAEKSSVKNREVEPGTQLHIHEARYGWAEDIWAPKQCSHGAGCKNVTDIVQRDVQNNELHLNPDKRGQYFNQHFWPETAMGPPIPRRVAIRYSYGNGPVYELVTAAVSNEKVCVHITPETSDPSSREIDYALPQFNNEVKHMIQREIPDADDQDIKHAERAVSLSMRFTGKERLLGSGKGIPGGNDPYTIEMLIKARDSGTIFFSGTDARNQALGICVHKHGDQFTIQHWWHRNDLHTGACFEANKWQHIAATWDGHTRRIYANKKFIKGDHPGSHKFPHHGGKIMIGTDPPGRSHNYRGEIAEIRIWRKCLSSNDLGKAINENLSRVDGLARWLLFDSVDHSRGDFSIQDRVNREVLKSVLAQPVWVGQPQPLPKVEETRPSAPAAPAQTNPMMSQLRELIDMKKQGLLTDAEFSAAKQQLLGLNGRTDSVSPPQYDQAEGHGEGSLPPGGTKTNTGEIGFD